MPIPVFVLETGALHAETLALLDRLRVQQAAHLQAPLTVYRPVAEAVVQFVDREGKDAMYKSIALRKACCGIRKMEPLGRALAGKSAWITGLRREQSGARAEVPLIDNAEQTTKGLLKFNPLANWTWGDVWHYIALNQVAYNPLHDQFYPSIGCAPCTRAIAWAKTSAPAAGGGRTKPPRSAACTSNNKRKPPHERPYRNRTARSRRGPRAAPDAPPSPEQRPPGRAGRGNHLHPARGGRQPSSALPCCSRAARTRW